MAAAPAPIAARVVSAPAESAMAKAIGPAVTTAAAGRTSLSAATCSAAHEPRCTECMTAAVIPSASEEVGAGRRRVLVAAALRPRFTVSQRGMPMMFMFMSMDLVGEGSRAASWPGAKRAAPWLSWSAPAVALAAALLSGGSARRAAPWVSWSAPAVALAAAPLSGGSRDTPAREMGGDAVIRRACAPVWPAPLSSQA